MSRRVRIEIRGTEIATVRRYGESESEAPTVRVEDVLQNARQAGDLREDAGEAL